MHMFLMNFLFDFDQKTGIFSGDRSDKAPPGAKPELYTSKNWLKLTPTAAIPEPGNPFPPGFNPEAATWEDQGDMDSGSLLVPKSPAPDDGNIGIRIALDPNSQMALPINLGPGTVTAPSADLTLVVCFGKPSQGKQPRSSPFEDATAAKAVQTTFVHSNQKSNQVDAAGNPISWFFPLGMVAFRPKGSKHRTHRYEFAVGVTVTSLGVTRHFSHDPEMDIST
jgi:hypothetical protein